MLVYKNFPPTSLNPHIHIYIWFSKGKKKETAYDKHKLPYKLDIRSDNVQAPARYSSPNHDVNRKYWAGLVTALQEISCYSSYNNAIVMMIHNRRETGLGGGSIFAGRNGQ